MSQYHGRSITGMCEKTGQLISGIDHLLQSLNRIVLTRIGSRVQRRAFGSDFFNMISAPGNESTRLKLVSLIARAILKWEPRVKLSHITFKVDTSGVANVGIFGSYNGQSINHSVPVLGSQT